MKVLVAFVAIIAALFVGNFLLGLLGAIFHWVVVAAVVLGVGYVVFSIVTPRKALGYKRRLVP